MLLYKSGILVRTHYLRIFLQTLRRLMLLCTAGQERFQGLGANFYRGTDGVMFCYDCTRKQTFECLEQVRRCRPLPFPHALLN